MREELYVQFSMKLAQKFDIAIDDFEYEMLKDLTDDEFKKGVMTFFQTHENVFKNNNIVALIRKYGKIESKNIPAEIWEQILDHIRRHGSNKQVENVSPATQRAIRSVGGIKAIGLADEERLPFLKRDFISNYADIEDSENNTQIEYNETLQITEEQRQENIKRLNNLLEDID